MSDADKNRRLYEELREADLHRALPSALPGETGRFDPPSLLSGPLPASRITGTEAWPPGTDQMELVRAFFEQSTGPFFFAYGPTFADDDVLVVEWESFVFGRSGVVYNNQYCWWLSMGDDRIDAIREYVDQHHAAVVIGPFGNWPQPKPSTGPRRRHRMFGEAPALAPDELDTSFEVVDEFDLDPRLLCDVRPGDSPSPVDASTGSDGARGVVRALRRARADGDAAAVSSLHGPGFRHHPIGERPFGWEHLPLEEIYAPLIQHLASPIHVRYGPVHADGDTAFEEMDIFARLDDGTVYNNWHTLLHVVRDGKIVQTREYCDTLHVWVTLGRWAPWAAEPVPPPTAVRRSNLPMIAWANQLPMMFSGLDRFAPFRP